MTDKQKTIKVRVVGKSHTRAEGGKIVSYPVDSEFEATEREVKAFDGRLVPVHKLQAAPAKDDGKVAALEKELGTLRERVTELEKANAELEEKNSELELAVASANKGKK